MDLLSRTSTTGSQSFSTEVRMRVESPHALKEAKSTLEKEMAFALRLSERNSM
jgi:hypothetical protein